MITPIILCGGSGTRLWPLSRNAYPKQLLPLISQYSLLQDTVLRALLLPEIQNLLVICNEEHRFLVAEQLQEIRQTHTNILLEPTGKNTAPAIAMAAFYLLANKEDPILLILPADHLIKDTQAFTTAMIAAEHAAAAGKLVTFGIHPTHPETGYGYIQRATKSADFEGFTVAQFVEKPSLDLAKQYIASGEYYWNSGMFMFRASRFLAELKQFAPDIYTACQQVSEKMTYDLDFVRLDKSLFEKCRSESIDYAVMEKTQDAVVIPLNSAWSDIGSWTALWEANHPNEEGNVMYGDVVTEQVTNSYLRAESRMLAVVGVQDHIVVETPDVVLVAHKDNSQAVKVMVENLKRKQRSETHLHRKVYRPWGNYETIDKSIGFQVKRITVKPGAALSLQLHHHRSEHWVVVSGVAKVTCGENVFTLQKNQSAYIPVATKHRLENCGTTPLEMIEVQSGDYLEEDDIVRFEDAYGRETKTVVDA